MKLILSLLLTTLLGCATHQGPPLPPSNFNDKVAAAAIVRDNIAAAIKTECGNLLPDGPCRSMSMIKTNDKQIYKGMLLNVSTALEIASGGGPDAEDGYATAQRILSTLEQMLRDQGVNTQ